MGLYTFINHGDRSGIAGTSHMCLPRPQLSISKVTAVMTIDSTRAIIMRSFFSPSQPGSATEHRVIGKHTIIRAKVADNKQSGPCSYRQGNHGQRQEHTIDNQELGSLVRRVNKVGFRAFRRRHRRHRLRASHDEPNDEERNKEQMRLSH